jgi:hypothetical protein
MAGGTPRSAVVFYESPKGSYWLEKGPNKYSIWVVSTKDPKRRKILSTEPGDYIDAESCFASPDEKWLLVREELFQRSDSVKFVALKKKGWFKSKLYDYVDKNIKPGTRHWTWSAEKWSDDSRRLKIGLTWPDNGEANIVFNIDTDEFERAP